MKSTNQAERQGCVCVCVWRMEAALELSEAITSHRFWQEAVVAFFEFTFLFLKSENNFLIKYINEF